MSAHSPAPWTLEVRKLNPGELVQVMAADGVQVAICSHFGRPFVFLDEHGGEVTETPEAILANHRLIAQAPNLLQALEALLGQWDNHKTLMGMALQDARAAVADAKGE